MNQAVQGFILKSSPCIRNCQTKFSSLTVPYSINVNSKSANVVSLNRGSNNLFTKCSKGSYLHRHYPFQKSVRVDHQKTIIQKSNVSYHGSNSKLEKHLLFNCAFLSGGASRKTLANQVRSPRSPPCLWTLPRTASVCSSLTVPSSSFHTSRTMAKSKFEYVRQFETDDPCLPNCWLVVRIDGKAFHRFTESHHYMKPNDERGLGLMTRAAQNVMAEFNEIVLAYGQSDEFSFIFHKASKVYNRRASKIMTNVVSLFSSSFTLFWPRFFHTQELQYPPSFDARVVLYPSDDNLKDYLSWRQADCHINNLYNTCFWKLVQEKGLSPAGAQERLKGTLSSDKNELLFSDFSMNYNTLPELYRKGTTLIRPRDVEFANDVESPVSNSKGSHRSKTKKPSSVVLHCDIIGKQFWEEHPYILGSKRPV